ncbi:MAG TPA: TolC family protein [Devosia sp.]|nr:TolC family protein [Devosia sp.]
MAVGSALLAAIAGCATNSAEVSAGRSSVCAAVTVAQIGCVRPAESDVELSAVGEAGTGFNKLIRDLVMGAPSVNAALTRWQAEEQKIEVARAALLPNAELFSEGGIRGAYGVTNVTTNPYSYGVRVSVPVFDGGRAVNTAGMQVSVSTAAKQAALDELASTILDLVAAGASVQHADQVLAVRRDQANAAKSLLGAVQSDKDSGTASKVDVDQVQSQLSGLDVERRQAEADRAQAVQSFAEITGRPPGKLDTIGSIAKQLPKGQDEAEAIAATDNPRIARILALKDAAQLDKQVADAGYLPNVSFDLEASRNGDLVSGDPEETDFSALIRFSLPLPFGGGVEAQRRQKALELRAANLEVDATRNGVFAGVDAALSRLGLARQGLALARAAEARAKAVLEGIRAERELGERSVFDELSALNGYAEARIKTADVAYELIVAEHLLAAQIGRIDDIYGIGLRG